MFNKMMGSKTLFLSLVVHLVVVVITLQNDHHNQLLFFVTAIDDDPKCSYSQSQDQACPNDSNGNPYTCRIGRKNFKELFPGINHRSPSCGSSSDETKSTYCDCNEPTVGRDESGVTGCYCNKQFRVCKDGTTCFHGAPCVPVGGDGGDDDDHDDGTYMCGCVYAQGDATWVGEHCEYKASDICDKTKYDVSHNGNWFCTNNGNCNNAIVNPREKCICKKGYYGLHCEFKEQPKCEINCQNGGICTQGVKKMFNHRTLLLLPSSSSSSSSSSHNNNGNELLFHRHLSQKTSSYCVCPEGFTGVTCEIQVDVTNKGCEDFPCQNGSTCRKNDETKEYYCDCSSSTIEDTDEKGNRIPYAGKSCEYKMTTQCMVPEGYDKSNYFCTNGGTCPLDFHRACICPTGTSGPRCEFMTEEPTKECSLPCINDGQCFFGSYPPNTDPYDIDFTKPENSEMHCKCPQGYTGDLCAIKVELCSGGTHACANSGDCVKDGEEWICDCSKALLGVTPTRGEKCENPATSYCVGPSANLESFCTNNGVCKDDVILDGKSHPGCICPKGYYGDYCEFYDPNHHHQTHGLAHKLVLGLSITLFVLTLIFFVWNFFCKEGSRKGHELVQSNPSYEKDDEKDAGSLDGVHHEII